MLHAKLINVNVLTHTILIGQIPSTPSTHLSLSDGQEEAANLLEDAHGQSASAELAGAEQHHGQPLHGVQDRGVRAMPRRPPVIGGCLEQLQHTHTIIHLPSEI